MYVLWFGALGVYRCLISYKPIKLKIGTGAKYLYLPPSCVKAAAKEETVRIEPPTTVRFRREAGSDHFLERIEPSLIFSIFGEGGRRRGCEG